MGNIFLVSERRLTMELHPHLPSNEEKEPILAQNGSTSLLLKLRTLELGTRNSVNLHKARISSQIAANIYSVFIKSSSILPGRPLSATLAA